jgi:methyl-accepting chemotaxis protein
MEEISSSVTEMAATLSSNLNKTKGAVHLSKSVKNLVTESSDSMSELRQSVNEIAEANARVEQLAKLIEEIGEKTELIDEIVFQTRLLSFVHRQCCTSDFY